MCVCSLFSSFSNCASVLLIWNWIWSFSAFLVLQVADGLEGTRQVKEWLLSPSYFGWPCNRPRLYTVLIRKGALLQHGGLNLISRLYLVPAMSVDSLLVSPEARHVTCADMHIDCITIRL